MNISISGKGQTVVFIHGFCENLSIWKSLQKELSKEFQIVLIDLPGHGSSPLLSKDFTIEEISNQVMDVLKKNGVKKFFVIGHSLGGYISLALADIYHKLVIGFGLFSSTTFPDDDEKKKLRDKVGAFVEEYGAKTFVDSLVPNLFAPDNRTKLVEEVEVLKMEGRKTTVNAIAGYSMAMKNRPDRSELLSNAMPKFIIAGEHDAAVPLEVSNKMIALMQNGESVVLKETGHNGFIEAPRESLHFTRNFLNTHLR